ncbi:MAG: FAD-dependent monooxygenase, partial [Xanthobacteraceae bacterium]
MPRPPRIAIIGGGIGGLAAALALERRGAEVVVHEQSGALSEIGAGLNLTPNAVKALRALGLEQEAQAIAAETDFLNIRSWKSGRYISRTKRGDFRQKFGAPNLSVHRADLLEVLGAALKTTQLRFGARCVGVEGGELLNIVAHIDSDAWTEESWTRQCDVSEVMTTYAAWNPALTKLYPCSERWYKWALYDRDPLEKWSVGRATLLGDSAHAMLPYLGTGAGMALEDACVLAAEIARGGDDLAAALSNYQRARVPRTKAAVLGARARAKENHLASPWARLKRDLTFKLRERFGGEDNTAFTVG